MNKFKYTEPWVNSLRVAFDDGFVNRVCKRDLHGVNISLIDCVHTEVFNDGDNAALQPITIQVLIDVRRYASKVTSDDESLKGGGGVYIENDLGRFEAPMLPGTAIVTSPYEPGRIGMLKPWRGSFEVVTAVLPFEADVSEYLHTTDRLRLHRMYGKAHLTDRILPSLVCALWHWMVAAGPHHLWVTTLLRETLIVHLRHVSDPRILDDRMLERYYDGCKLAAVINYLSEYFGRYDCPSVGTNRINRPVTLAFREKDWSSPHFEDRRDQYRYSYTRRNAIANAIGIHPRSLNRTLHRLCLKIADLLDAFRLPFAFYFIDNGLSLNMVADRCGFSQQGLTEFMKKVVGTGPNSLRRQSNSDRYYQGETVYQRC